MPIDLFVSLVCIFQMLKINSLYLKGIFIWVFWRFNIFRPIVSNSPGLPLEAFFSKVGQRSSAIINAGESGLFLLNLLSVSFSPLKMIELSVSQSGQMRLGMRVFIKNFQTLKAYPCRKIFLNSSNSLAEGRVVSRFAWLLSNDMTASSSSKSSFAANLRYLSSLMGSSRTLVSGFPMNLSVREFKSLIPLTKSKISFLSGSK